MKILNEELRFSDAPAYVQEAFVPGTQMRTRLEGGYELYKFTEYELMPDSSRGNVSVWWAPMCPRPNTTDLGLDGHLAFAKSQRIPLQQYVRQVFAVMLGWNSLSTSQSGFVRVVRFRLRQPIWAFGGIVGPQDQTQFFRDWKPDRWDGLPAQRIVGEISDSCAAQPMPNLIGGAYQFWIPNLKGEYVASQCIHLLPPDI